MYKFIRIDTGPRVDLAPVLSFTLFDWLVPGSTVNGGEISCCLVVIYTHNTDP